MGIIRISARVFRMLSINKKSVKYVQNLQNKRLRKMLHHAVGHSEFYRDLYQGIDLDHCDLQDLPVIDKPMMMENFDRFVTRPDLKREELKSWLEDKSNLGKMYKGKYIPFRTSGTTGENALIVYDSNAMDYAYAAYMARRPQRKETPSLTKALFGKKLRTASVLMSGGPYPAYTMVLYTPKGQQLFMNHKIVSLLDPVDTLVAQLNEHQPTSLLSYPSFMEVLAREQLAGRLNLNLASLASCAEPLSVSMKNLAKKAWGMDVIDSYASSECFAMARSCKNFDRMHVMSDLCILEVVDRHNKPVPDGQTGEKILLTNLFNTVQPFIRYEISDVTGYSIEHCDCGWPFPTLLPVEGRSDDIFYIDRKGGGYEMVHPYFFLGPIFELDHVREYQLVQTDRNEFTFSYASNHADKDLDSCIKAVLEAGLVAAGFSLDRFDLLVKQVNKIPRDPTSGKFRQIVSLIGAPEDLNETSSIPDLNL
jgi:phenylacetate-coenzyme A ligase PaaK-like adenylate-forming protein